MTSLPFGRILKLGARGTDVQAVKLALNHAHVTGFTTSRYLGTYAVAAIMRFQRDHGLDDDGVYGPATHAKLAPFFDAKARELYERQAPTKQLPTTFTPTHDTAGLDGYPAVDVFMKPGTIALAPADGTIDKLSGHEPSGHATPGGAYGLTCYLRRAGRPGRYFLTHFGTLRVKAGTKVKRGDPLGTAVDFEAATNGVTESHIHEGYDPSYT